MLTSGIQQIVKILASYIYKENFYSRPKNARKVKSLQNKKEHIPYFSRLTDGSKNEYLMLTTLLIFWWVSGVRGFSSRFTASNEQQFSNSSISTSEKQAHFRIKIIFAANLDNLAVHLFFSQQTLPISTILSLFLSLSLSVYLSLFPGVCPSPFLLFPFPTVVRAAWSAVGEGRGGRGEGYTLGGREGKKKRKSNLFFFNFSQQ